MDGDPRRGFIPIGNMDRENAPISVHVDPHGGIFLWPGHGCGRDQDAELFPNREIPVAIPSAAAGDHRGEGRRGGQGCVRDERGTIIQITLDLRFERVSESRVTNDLSRWF
jgi:hypothetical protein